MAITVRKTQSGKKRYLVRVIDNMRNYYPIKTFATRAEAERYHSQLKIRKDSGKTALLAAKRKMKVEVFFAEWHQARQYKISKGWQASLVRMSKTYILPLIGGLSLEDLSPPHIGRILSEMKAKGRSAQSILHVYTLLKSAFGDAVEYYGYLECNPVRKQDRPKLSKIERAYLTPEQSWALMEHCQGHYLAPAIYLSVLSGLRPSEVQALQWRSVDFVKGQILVCAAFKRTIGLIEPFPKQKDWGIVPMPTVLADFLQTNCRFRFPKSFVAPAAQGGMLEYKKFYNGLIRLCQEAGVPKVSPHELRHSCTEIWFRSGATLEDIRRLLNHKSTETTRRYVHRTDDRLNALAKSICAPVG